ncbi:esterase FrsA [Levilactobacillus namurensis]|nr:esterase FrsA [Levilactobacillus namurensis]
MQFNNHWSSQKFSKNMLQDALVKHVLGLVNYRMADIGEVLEVNVNLKDGDEQTWIRAWGTMANRLQKLAEQYEQTNKTVSASSAYLRASTYWRVALMYFSDVADSRMKQYCRFSQACYDKSLALSGYPGKAIAIPYENTTLPGHYFQAPNVNGKAPLLIVVPGRDTWADDTRWVTDAAIKRGFNALTFDGPGQGMTLRLQGLPFRPDFENVMKPVLDFVDGLSDVDSSRIGVMGMSFGGFQVPRAAAADHRIKVCIADPGNIAWGKMIGQRLSKVLALPKQLRPAMLDDMLDDYTWKHGCSEKELLQELAKYDNSDVVAQIQSKVLVLNGAAEVNPEAAQQFYDQLTCPKDYLFFDEDSTAQQHTQMGGYAPASELIFNWIEDNL